MKDIPKDTLRIIDANINRIGEGVRVLEEFARMSLNDTDLTQQLKNIRHEVLNIGTDLQEQLINARDSEEISAVIMDYIESIKKVNLTYLLVNIQILIFVMRKISEL